MSVPDRTCSRKTPPWSRCGGGLVELHPVMDRVAVVSEAGVVSRLLTKT